MSDKPIILAIESSCDDTSIAILRGDRVLSNVVSSQQIHNQYGGVVPELASRAHLKNIITVFDSAIHEAQIKKSDIDAIAYTNGPGLMGSLLVGISFAKSLSLALKIPLIAINHIEAHVLAHLIDAPGKVKPSFPFLCLTVSGGHTQLVKVSSPYKMDVIGSTIDDAAGEAFDKVSKIIGLPYPGGPILDKLAQQGDASKYNFSDPTQGKYDFSFSGLKTSILYFLQKEMRKDSDFIKNNINDICASVQSTIVTSLEKQLSNAVEDLNINQVAIAGGVSANSGLRKMISDKVDLGWEVFIPDFQFCTDNAAMIGITGYYKYLEKDFTNISLVPMPRLKI